MVDTRKKMLLEILRELPAMFGPDNESIKVQGEKALLWYIADEDIKQAYERLDQFGL